MSLYKKTYLNSSPSGFTLIEVILAATILGIISMIAINSFNEQVERARLKRAVQSMINFSKLVKSKSMSSNSKCRLIVNHREGKISVSNELECEDVGSMQLLDSSEKSNGIRICGTVMTRNLDMTCEENIDGSDVDINGLPKESTSYEFSSTGHASNGALFKFISPKIKKGYCIIITSPIGLIRKGRIDRNDQCNFTN